MNFPKNKIIIDGLVLVNPMVGITRYVVEVVKALDKIVPLDVVEFLVPSDAKHKLKLVNIKTVTCPAYFNKMHIPYRKFVRNYIKKYARLYVNMSSSLPSGLCGIVCLHDIRPLCFNDSLYSGKPLLFKIRFFFMCLRIKHQATVIITDSEDAKQLISEKLHIKPERLQVVYCGWQHFESVPVDSKIFDRNPEIKEKPFYFTLGSMAPHKNFKWIVETAKNNPDSLFIVAGGIEKGICGNKNNDDFSDNNNVVYLGRISDGEVKCLMKKCKAFIFPSLFEGFGIPPLEALSAGAQVIVSNSSCLPEIYANSAYYIDPNNYNVNLDKLLTSHAVDGKAILSRYSWDKAAGQWWKLICQN